MVKTVNYKLGYLVTAKNPWLFERGGSVEVNIRPPTMLVKLFTLAQDLHPRLLVKSIFRIFINNSWLLVTATSTFSGASKLCNRTSSPFIFHFGFWDKFSRVHPTARYSAHSATVLTFSVHSVLSTLNYYWDS